MINNKNKIHSRRKSPYVCVPVTETFPLSWICIEKLFPTRVTYKKKTKNKKQKKKRVIHLSWSQKTNSILQFFVPVFPRITANSLISALSGWAPFSSKRLPLPHFPKYRYIKIILQFSEQIQHCLVYKGLIKRSTLTNLYFDQGASTNELEIRNKHKNKTKQKRLKLTSLLTVSPRDFACSLSSRWSFWSYPSTTWFIRSYVEGLWCYKKKQDNDK